MGLLKEFFTTPRRSFRVVRFNGLPTEVQNTADFGFDEFDEIADTSWNLQVAKRVGIKPLTMADILSQIPEDQIHSMVLFDTAPNNPYPGNHWRVIDVDQDKKEAVLQHCGNFGNYDHKKIRPLRTPFDWELFTGVSVEHYILDGKKLPLSLVVKLYEDKTSTQIQLTETILWSDKAGRLSKKGSRLL